MHAGQRESLLPFSEQSDVIANQGGGIFSCARNVSICCLGYWCPCYLFGRTAHRASIVSSTLYGCLAYLMVFGIVMTLGMITMLHYLSELSDYSECETAAPHPPRSGSDDGSSDDDITLRPGAPSGSHCDDILWAAVRIYIAHTIEIQLLAAVMFGTLLGYYRHRISIVLGHKGSALKSFVLHCLPCTSACALCQEARAVESLSFATAYTGSKQPSSEDGKMSF